MSALCPLHSPLAFITPSSRVDATIPQCRQVTPVIKADSFLSAAKARGYDFYTGVPCSFLTPMINRVISDHSTEYVPAASEGEAVAIAAGAWLAGRGTEIGRAHV